ncbi:hypothetical protein CLOSCI_03369 [[Clostridium] scindens ATCC 35704]|nr:hypothetical protein CLOSCI_03369 [[Clostridium] scindens ATCC 35704]
MLACPMIYCKFFGFMFFRASGVQNVCLKLRGIIFGNGVFSWFFVVLLQNTVQHRFIIAFLHRGAVGTDDRNYGTRLSL